MLEKKSIGFKITENEIYNSYEYFSEAMIAPTGFREYDVRWRISGTEGADINYNGFVLLGKAFGEYARRRIYNNETDRPVVVVGFDFRSYSQNVKNAFVLGLLSAGAEVLDVGMVMSPVLYFAQHLLDVKAGAMITASHNDNGWTGIKLCNGLSRTFEPDDILEFKKFVYSSNLPDSAGGVYRFVDGVREAYMEEIVRAASISSPLKIVVGTGNGTAGHYTPEVFRAAGCEVIEEFTEPDWDFPNFNPNPENIAFLRSIGERVRETGADLGVGIDGDGDRLGIVDNEGREVFSDKVGLLIGRHLAPKVIAAGGKPSFVVDVKSTFLCEKIMGEAGADVIWEKTGHSYIKAAVRKNSATAGFERSGHMFFSRPFGRGYDDATLAGLIFASLLSGAGKPLDALLAELPVSYQSPNMQPKVDDKVKYDVVDRIIETYTTMANRNESIAGRGISQVITINGIRVQFDDDSWFLVRASSNTPSLVVLGESFSTKRRLYDMMEEVIGRLENIPEVGGFDQVLPPYDGEPV